MDQRSRNSKATTSPFDEHAIAIAERQYLQPGDDTVAGLFRRVADWVATPESDQERATHAGKFFELMYSKRFCPGGRVLAGAATQHGNVLNCFVQDGSPDVPGSNAWVLRLATKLALVTKVGGGNGLNLDPIKPKRPFSGPVGSLIITIKPNHPDYDKVKAGTYMDLVHGKYVTKGYLYASFAEHAQGGGRARVIEVGDSVESIWSSGSEMIMSLLKGEDVLLDLSRLRPEGTPVNGSGGTSSGPSSFAVEVFDNFAYWASLGGAEHAGPVATLRYVFSPTLRVIRQGGTRRGAGMATMSVTNPDVYDFITCKDLHREQQEGDISTFNISVLVGDEFMANSSVNEGTLRDIAEHAWQTGEPGIIFIDRINAHNAMRQSYGDIKATNPCVTGDTWVQTHVGARRVRDLIGRRFCAVVDGKRYGVESAGFWSTGVKPVFRIRTRRGFELRLTANHRLKKVGSQGKRHEPVWAEVSQLSMGDLIALSNHREVAPWSGRGSFTEGWLLGLLVGAGTFALDQRLPRACLDLWGDDRQFLAHQAKDGIKRLFGADASLWITESDHKIRLDSSDLAALAASYGITPGAKTVTDAVEEASVDSYQGFLCGLFDTNGSVQGSQSKGVSVRLAQSSAELLKRVQRMLSRLGIISSINLERRPEGYRLLPDGKRGKKAYLCRADHELVIANDNLRQYQELVGFEGPAKQRRLAALLANDNRALNREPFADEVVAVESDGEEEVFDVTVEHVHEFDANGLAAHNCGEIPLFPGEPCDLGAINLAAYVKEPDAGLAGFDFEGFRTDVATCIRFLDNVLDVNRFALDDNREMSMKLRRLGLGIMGLADALIRMGYRYDSEEGREATRSMINELREGATKASEALAVERGAFPEHGRSSLARPRRNVALLTVAPTGTTSMLMGVSSGIEPVYAPFTYRKIGSEYKSLIHPLFKELLDKHSPDPEFARGDTWDWERVVEAVQENHGSVQGLTFVPEQVRAVLLCAHDIAPEDHVKMQGVVQTAFDEGGGNVANSISKTINLPNRATARHVFDAYSLAFSTGCKGITVYRDGSREFQVLSTKAKKQEERAREEAQDDLPLTPSGHEPAVAGAIGSAARQDRLPGEPLFDRPARLTGFTDTVKLTTSSGERRGFYVTVNKQHGLPTEVFITSGKAGDESNADSEALGRVVSIALQYGVPAEAIVKTLRGINGGMYGTYQGRVVASKADLIAIALESSGVENSLNHHQSCPDCGNALRFEEGCQKCAACGYSRCG